MHEFDDVLTQMGQHAGDKGKNYIHTGKDFDTIFPDIQRVFAEILPKKR